MAAMSPAVLSQLVAIGGLVVAAVGLFLTFRRDGATERRERDVMAAESRGMSDKLDSISDMTRDTRDTVKDISRQLNDHSQKLARIETQVEDHGRRLEALERAAEEGK